MQVSGRKAELMDHCGLLTHAFRPFLCVMLFGASWYEGCHQSVIQSSTLSGTITLNDQPIGHGSIRLSPLGQTGGTGGAAAIAEGQYQIQTPGMVSGLYQVQIYAERKTGRMLPSFDGRPPRPETVQYIPGRYHRNSELEIELAPGRNLHDFHLESTESAPATDLERQ